MCCHVAVGWVCPGFITVRPQDASAQFVGHDLPRYAAEKLQRAHVRADPVRQALRSASFSVGVVRRAQHREEHLRRPRLPNRPEEDEKREALALELIEAITGSAEPEAVARKWSGQYDAAPLTADIRELVERFRDS